MGAPEVRPLCTPLFILSTVGWVGAPGAFLGGFAPTAPESGRSAPHPGLLSCEKKVGKDSPAQSGKSGWVCGRNPIEGVVAPPQGERSIPLGGSRGAPWRIFGDFLFEKKVTRGGGAERPPRGGYGGAAPQKAPGAPPTRGRKRKTEVKGPPPLYMEGVPRGQKLLRHRRIFVVNFSRKLCKKR